MISKNLLFLRKRANLSQEALAEKLGISRQTLAKWENEESIPDVLHCDRISELFMVNLDDLLHSDLQTRPAPSKGRYVFGTVTVGEKGQIVIPKQARDLFNIKPGDTLLILGDEERGIAIPNSGAFSELFDAAFMQKKGGDKK